MLPATEQETNDVVQYMAWKAPDLTVEMVRACVVATVPLRKLLRPAGSAES